MDTDTIGDMRLHNVALELAALHRVQARLKRRGFDESCVQHIASDRAWTADDLILFDEYRIECKGSQQYVSGFLEPWEIVEDGGVNSNTWYVFSDLTGVHAGEVYRWFESHGGLEGVPQFHGNPAKDRQWARPKNCHGVRVTGIELIEEIVDDIIERHQSRLPRGG